MNTYSGVVGQVYTSHIWNSIINELINSWSTMLMKWPNVKWFFLAPRSSCNEVNKTATNEARQYPNHLNLNYVTLLGCWYGIAPTKKGYADSVSPKFKQKSVANSVLQTFKVSIPEWPTPLSKYYNATGIAFCATQRYTCSIMRYNRKNYIDSVKRNKSGACRLWSA